MVKKKQTKSKSVKKQATGQKRVVQRPPVLTSDNAVELHSRLRSAGVSELAEWLENGAESEFAKLHHCEDALLTSILYHKLKRWSDVCRIGETFMSGIDNVLAEADNKSLRTQCHTNAGYLIELMGQAYVQLGEYQRAALCFETAIEVNPLMQDAYLHWAELSQRLGMRELSSRIVAAGLQKIESSPELRMYQQAVTNRPTVSVCMIVKDEEEFLEGCLFSVRDIADEIILVDTGSTDRTIKIAESFGCKIFHQKWEGNFSKHRNYSLEQASSDWLFVIDADERLVEKDIPKLKECLQRTEFDLLSLTVYNVAERSGKETTVLPSVRIFRRELGLQYEGIVHNRLNFATDMKELRCPVGLIHHGYDLAPEKMKLKHQRSMTLLREQIKQDDNNAFAHFNLAQLIRAKSNLNNDADCREVIKHATRVIELTEPSSLEFGSIHLMAHHQLATANYSLKEYHLAEEACLQALDNDSEYLDCVIMLAHIQRAQKRFTESIESYNRYLKLQENYSEHQQTSTLIIVHLNSRANAHYNIGIAAEALENYATALAAYQKALQEEPDYLDASARAGWMCYKLSNRALAQKFFRREIEVYPEREPAYLGMVETFEEVGDYSAAEATLRNAMQATNNSGNICSRYSDLLLGTGRASEALDLLNKHRNSLSHRADYLASRGRVELKVGQTAEALDSLTVAEKKSPGDCKVLTGLADANLMLENNAEACEWYMRALQKDPHSAHLMRNHAIALARTGQLEAAVEGLANYAPIAPDDRESRFILGALLLKLERGAEALAVYETLLREEPEDQNALLALSDCYLSLGGIQAAEVGYRRLLQANPNHAIAKERLTAIETQQSPVS